jgi:hypothetical protein
MLMCSLVSNRVIPAHTTGESPSEKAGTRAALTLQQDSATHFCTEPAIQGGALASECGRNKVLTQ